MRKLLDGFYLACGALACVSIVLITLVISAQVILNILDKITFAMGLPSVGMIPSYSLFTGYGLAFATFLAFGPAIRAGAHIRVTLLQERLPRGFQRWLLVGIAILGTCIGAVMLYSLATMSHESWTYGDRSSGLVSVALWIPQAVMAFGAFGLMVACADTAVELIRTGHSEGMKYNELEEVESMMDEVVK